MNFCLAQEQNAMSLTMTRTQTTRIGVRCAYNTRHYITMLPVTARKRSEHLYLNRAVPSGPAINGSYSLLTTSQPDITLIHSLFTFQECWSRNLGQDMEEQS